MSHFYRETTTKNIQISFRKIKIKGTVVNCIWRVTWISLSRLENEQKEKCLKEVRWLQKVLKEQVDEENRRKKELDFVFAEEAERMWNKQQEIWDR